ncbi:conserved hypothetical protein [Ricinus communis]|uniref:Uncharacterized protein n=1 Tax=Ricinus communis TaxID=3988 RepID=B9RK55_RICCO|nr:conserved hypothetical protein [Ricinus communis]
MASLVTPSAPIFVKHKVNLFSARPISTNSLFNFYKNVVGSDRCHTLSFRTKAKLSAEANVIEKESISGNEKIGLEINEARPDDKLPYRGAWLWVGSEMIHLMELPNPDPLNGRPEHGGRDRHTCIAIRIPYTLSKSGRPAIFTRDPDANALEFTQVDN